MYFAVDALPPLDGRIGPQEVVFDQRSMVTTMGLRLESDHLAVSLIRHIFMPPLKKGAYCFATVGR